MKILNLGCGTKTSNQTGVINVDFSVMLRIKNSTVLNAISPLILRGERLKKYKALPDNILLHDISKSIPADKNSIDVVYNSHLLEHIDREHVETFLRKVKDVLKPGGIHRIVVPDLEYIARSYVKHADLCENSLDEHVQHDSYVNELLEQSVRKDAWGTSHQSGTRRFIENLFLGDARQRSETHQWMYDRFNLTSILKDVGYKEVFVHSYNTSEIPAITDLKLDLNNAGTEYKPQSLYIEAIK